MISCTYSPQISPGNSDLTPISSSPPTLVHRSTIIFTYPYISPTLTMEIRNPKLENTLQMQLRRIVNVTRGNKVGIRRLQGDPKAEILEFEVEAMSPSDRGNLFDFITASLGKEIGFLDYESRQWMGFITNPAEPIIQVTAGCGFSHKFMFEGDLV